MSPVDLITSIKNPQIKLIRDLLNSKDARTENGLYVIEGIRLSEEALLAGIPPETVLYCEGVSERGQQIIRALPGSTARVISVPEEVMDKISATETSQGLLMVIPLKMNPLPPKADLVLVLDQIRDPGNAGTILRTAAAAAVQAVFFSPGSVDPYMPKVVRSGMGAHFHLSIRQMSWSEIISFCTQTSDPPLEILTAESGSGKSIWQCDFKKPVALVIGGEAEGVSSQARQSAGTAIHIPMPGGFESLNAAVAASIILFEVVHQRST